MTKKGLPVVIARAVMSLYLGDKRKLEWNQSYPKTLGVQVALHQTSALSMLLFAIVVKIITEYAGEGLMNQILFADDLVLLNESMESLREKF